MAWSWLDPFVGQLQGLFLYAVYEEGYSSEFFFEREEAAFDFLFGGFEDRLVGDLVGGEARIEGHPLVMRQ